MKILDAYLVILFLPSLLFSQTFRHTELLGKPTDHNIAIRFIMNDSTLVNVQYGTAANTYTDQLTWTLALPDQVVELNPSNLIPDTKYYYRLRLKKVNDTTISNGTEHTFHTARNSGSTFSFVVQADPHMDAMSDTALYRLCLKNQLEDGPDFMIDLGDFLMSDKLTNSAKVIPRDTITYRSHLLRSYYESIAHSVPLYIAIGNHEGESGWYHNGTANNVAIWGATDRIKYFANPTPNQFYTGDTSYQTYVGQRGNYYAWTWGDALFIVLDPYWYTNPKPDSLNGWRWTLGKTQYDWLRSTLEQSQAKFKFVFSHQIIGGDPEGRGGVEFADRYEWGGQSLDGTYTFNTNRPGWYKPIKDLLTENRVTIFFHGHDHFYGKQDKDCMVYQETPQPSLPNFMNANQAADYGYFQGQIIPNTGHLRVTVGPDGVKTEYVRAYLPKNETSTRKNKDISATYFIGKVNCYDSLATGAAPIIWNAQYADELIYPNPSNDITYIQLKINANETGRIELYNENGSLIRTLMNATPLKQGAYLIEWKGENSMGQMVPAGNYYFVYQGSSGSKQTGTIQRIK